MIKEIRKYDTTKIKYMIIQLKSQLLENRFKFSQAELTNTSLFREIRKLIAQLFTILSERKEKLTTADWKVYSEIISKNENLEIFKKKSRNKEKDFEKLEKIEEAKEVSLEISEKKKSNSSKVISDENSDSKVLKKLTSNDEKPEKEKVQKKKVSKKSEV